MTRPKSLATLISTMASILVLSGCQTGRTVSIDEAISISKNVQDLSLRLPERKIHDYRMTPYVLGIFEERPMHCDDPNITLAEISRSQRYGFYHRSVAALTAVAERSGPVKANSVEERYYLKEWDINDSAELYETISKSYERMGEVVAALEWMKRAVSRTEPGSASEGGKMGQLAYLAALAGDTESAATYSSRSWSSESGNWTGYWRLRGRAAYLESVGRLDEAAEAFETARDVINRLNSGNPRFERMLSHLAWIRMKQGRLVEAEALLVQALKTGRSGSTSQMPLRNSYSMVLYEQGRYQESADMAKLSIYLGNLDCISRDSVYRAVARNNLARSLMALGQWNDAAEQFELLSSELQTNQAVFQAKFAGAPDHALSLILSNRPERAIPMLEERLVRLEDLLGSKHYDTGETRAFLAMANVAVGRNDVALELFTSSVPLMLQRSRQSETHSEGTQSITFKRRMVLESYIGLLADIRGTALESDNGIDAASEAFKIADAARSSTVERMLARSSARSAVLDPVLSDLSRREQDLQRQIGAQWASLSSGSLSGTIDAQASNGAKTSIDNLRIARAALMEEIEGKFPDYANLINPSRTGIDEVKNLLHEDERLLSVYIGEQSTFVWSVPKKGAPTMHVINRSRSAIASLVDEVKSGLDPSGVQTLGDIPEFDVVSAYNLFDLLFGASSQSWRKSETLIYVPHSSLSTLPLSVLPMTSHVAKLDRAPLFSGYRDVKWIINEHDIATLPSVSALRSLRNVVGRRTAQLSFVGFGNPVFTKKNQNGRQGARTKGVSLRSGASFVFRATPQTQQMRSATLSDLPPLPDTDDEIRELAVVMNADPSRDLFLGLNASEESVKTTSLKSYKVVAFATHGLVSGDLDGLRQPALALSAPEFTGGKEDGLLTMDEIMALRLDADWVILSACNTGAADGSGAEAVSGLGGAFFYAGARAMLVTYWPVETTSARLLTTKLFRWQAADASMSRSKATRQAAMFLINHKGLEVDTGEIVFSYAHPIFWGPFGLIGLPK